MFAPGDVVSLKSRSDVKMTVRHTIDYLAVLNTGLAVGVHVDWFEGSTLHRAAFSADQLSLSEPLAAVEI